MTNYLAAAQYLIDQHAKRHAERYAQSLTEVELAHDALQVRFFYENARQEVSADLNAKWWHNEREHAAYKVLTRSGNRYTRAAVRPNTKHLQALDGTTDKFNGEARFFAFVYCALTSQEARATQTTTFPRKPEHKAEAHADDEGMITRQLHHIARTARYADYDEAQEMRNERGLAFNAERNEWQDADTYDGANTERSFRTSRRGINEFQPVTIKREVFSDDDAAAWSAANDD